MLVTRTAALIVRCAAVYGWAAFCGGWHCDVSQISRRLMAPAPEAVV